MRRGVSLPLVGAVLVAVKPTSKAPRALTVAGSDSSGGAGLQADLATFAALGVFGASAVTAVTVQDTRRVRAVHVMPPSVVAAQVETVLEDLGASAVKTGMLCNRAIVEAVARIKVVLQHDGLIKTAKVRRPQLGISEAEQKQLLDSYRVLKRNEFRSAETGAESKRRQAVG